MPALFVDALKFRDGKPVAFGMSDMSSTGTPARRRVPGLLEHGPAQPVALARCTCPTGRLSHLLYQTTGDIKQLFVSATRRTRGMGFEQAVDRSKCAETLITGAKVSSPSATGRCAVLFRVRIHFFVFNVRAPTVRDRASTWVRPRCEDCVERSCPISCLPA